MVIVNLYPFRETVAQPDINLEDARANIDIGGPSMLRASAKNFLRVAPVCDPRDYPDLIRKMNLQNGALNFQDRFSLAQKAFTHTAEYDQAIAAYLPTLSGEEAASAYLFSEGIS
jgi:phosphoribosylaminoimidazolecarboxamide formyltransferase/IMP cyclohydrolase